MPRRAASLQLAGYKAKRNFAETPEPSGDDKPSTAGKRLQFVVQKHAASSLHYDFRLELDGVLVSWAVPKGPSLKAGERRLAVHVEDHPLDYGDFEGRIPEGHYGAGEVIVWDRGSYEPTGIEGDREEQETRLRKELEDGKLEITLEGEKLKGAWLLIHTKDKSWLLIKRHDSEESDRDVTQLVRSVKSNRTIEDVREEPQWLPMLASEAEAPFSDPDWTFEVKLDGIRLVAEMEGDEVRLFTRNGIDAAPHFDRVVAAIRNLPFDSCALDGEMVSISSKGVPNFQALMEIYRSGAPGNPLFFLFDVLSINGEDLRGEPWTERRKRLEQLPISPPLRLVDSYQETGESLFNEAHKLGFEGVMAKKRSSRYESGVRSKNWLKIKGYHSEEFLVGGFTRGEGTRKNSFGALVLGKESPNGLIYVGNTGGGFSESELRVMRERLDRLTTDHNPFAGHPVIERGTTWVAPQTVVEVKFSGWTKDEKLRFPRFLRVREDMGKKADLPTELQGLAGESAELQVEGHTISFTNLDKELWPGVTKRDLVRYYADLAPLLLPFLKDRPLSFIRCPAGVSGPHIFSKHYDKGRPEFVEVVKIYSESNRKALDFVLCNNLATLLWLGQIAALDLNPWDSRCAPGPKKWGVDFASSEESLEASILNSPDYLVFDLDPNLGAKQTVWSKRGWDRVVEVALTLRELMKGIGLTAYAKSSGKSGLHVYVPTEREFSYDEIRAAARTFGEEAQKKLPGKVTLEFNVRKRPDAAFIDVNQNVRGKTMAAPYSPRVAAQAFVSTPIEWDEMPDFEPTQFSLNEVRERVQKVGDPWADFLSRQQRLPI